MSTAPHLILPNLWRWEFMVKLRKSYVFHDFNDSQLRLSRPSNNLADIISTYHAIPRFSSIINANISLFRDDVPIEWESEYTRNGGVTEFVIPTPSFNPASQSSQGSGSQKVIKPLENVTDADFDDFMTWLVLCVVCGKFSPPNDQYADGTKPPESAAMYYDSGRTKGDPDCLVNGLYLKFKEKVVHVQIWTQRYLTLENDGFSIKNSLQLVLEKLFPGADLQLHDYGVSSYLKNRGAGRGSRSSTTRSEGRSMGGDRRRDGSRYRDGGRFTESRNPDGYHREEPMTRSGRFDSLGGGSDRRGGGRSDDRSFGGRSHTDRGRGDSRDSRERREGSRYGDRDRGGYGTMTLAGRGKH